MKTSTLMDYSRSDEFQSMNDETRKTVLNACIDNPYFIIWQTVKGVKLRPYLSGYISENSLEPALDDNGAIHDDCVTFYKCEDEQQNTLEA